MLFRIVGGWHGSEFRVGYKYASGASEFIEKTTDEFRAAELALLYGVFYQYMFDVPYYVDLAG